MLSALCIRSTCRISQFGNKLISSRVHPTLWRSSNFSRPILTKGKSSLSGNETLNNLEVRKDDFKLIYKFPHILLARSICRLKLYQTAITLIALPVTGYLSLLGTVQYHVFVSSVAVSGFAFLMLFVMGEFFRRLVGYIHFNPSEDLVKISHLTFWGTRQNIIIPTEDFVPLSDTSENPNDIYVRLMRYTHQDRELFLCLKFGEVKDQEAFTHIFGSMDLGKYKLNKGK